MGTFASRQVVLISFPFSDLSATKLRPALILANAGKDDWMQRGVGQWGLCRPRAGGIQGR